MSSVHQHPVTEAELLLYTDGELSGKTPSRIASHVADCVDCRTSLGDREKVLTAFAGLHNNQSPFSECPPPNRWEPLEMRIDAWENQQRAGSLAGRLNGVFTLRFGLAGTAAVMLTVAILCLTYWQNTVSANTLLKRASLAQSERLRTVSGRILHCTLLIRRWSTMPGDDAMFSYETWQDASGRVLQEKSSSPTLITEMQHVYQDNGLDWGFPLSAAMYEKWRSALPGKQDSVVRTSRGQWTLTTVAGEQAGVNKAQLVVGAEDNRPVAVRIWIRGIEYEITEVGFDSQQPTQLKSSFLISPLSSAMPIPASKTRKAPIVQRTPEIVDASSMSAPPVRPTIYKIEDNSATATGPTFSPESPTVLAGLFAANTMNSDVTEKDHELSTGESAGARPSPRLSYVMAFTAKSTPVPQSVPGSPFPTVVTPTFLPVTIGIPEHRNHVNTEPFKKLIKKLGLKKNKGNGSAEPAKPGG